MGWVKKQVTNVVNTVKRTADDVLGIDDSGGIVGSTSDALADLDDGVREALSNELVVTIASIAATAAGQAWAVPLIQGASVAAQGGDINDVLEASAKAYVAGQVGAKVGAGVGSSVASSTGSQIAGSIIGQGAGSATAAAIVGGDPKKAFITGGALATVPYIMGESEYFADISDKMEAGTATKGEIATYKAAQSVVAATVTGKDINEEAIASIAAGAYLGGEVLQQIDPNNELSEAEAALVYDIVNSSTRAYITDGKIDEAVMKEIAKYSSKELGKKLEGIKESIFGTSASYEDLTEKADAITENTANRTKALEDFRKAEADYEAALADLNETKAEAEAAQTLYVNGDITKEQANARIKKYNTAVSVWDKTTGDITKALNDAATAYNNYEDEFTLLTEEYDSLMISFTENADKIDEALAPAYDELNKAFVKGMDPNFDPEQYAEINSLSEDVDPYEHWLTEGASAGLATNYDTAEGLAEGYKYAVDDEKQRIYEEAIDKAGIAGKGAVTEDSAKAFFDKLEQQHGNNLDALREVNGATDVAWNQLEEAELLAALSPDVIAGYGIDKLGWTNPETGKLEWLDPTSDKPATSYRIWNADTGKYEVRKAVWSEADIRAVVPEGSTNIRISDGRVSSFTDPSGESIILIGGQDISKVPEGISYDEALAEAEKNKLGNYASNLEKDPLTYLFTLTELEEDALKDIKEAAGLEDYVFDIAINAANIAKSTNNDQTIRQAVDLVKTNDADAIQNYNNIISKDATTWGGVYAPTDEDVVNVTRTLGADPDLDQQAVIQEYVDLRYVDEQEIRDIAAQEAYNITDEEVAKLAGQFDEATKLSEYQQQFDPLGTTREESGQFYADLGYDATAAEIANAIGKAETDAKDSIGRYVDPRQVTEAEAAKFLKDLGYEATPEEIAQFTGQSTSRDYQTDQTTAVGAYVDPRLVTLDEARAFLSASGYAPTDEEVARFAGQFDQAAQEETIKGYVDPRYVDIDEIKEVAAGQGYDITDEQAAKLAGQFDEATKLSEYGQQFDPLATTEEEVRDFFNRYRYDATDEEIQRFISGTRGEEDSRRDIGGYVIPGLGDIQSDIGGIKGDISGIEGEVSGLGDRIGGIEGDIGGLGDQIGGLGDQVGGVEKGISNTQKGLGQGLGAVMGLISGMGQRMERQNRTNRLLSLLETGSGAGVQETVKSVDPAEIKYLYDIGGESIFATPEQEKLFVSPYAQGGQVHNSTEELLRLLENK